MGCLEKMLIQIFYFLLQFNSLDISFEGLSSQLKHSKRKKAVQLRGFGHTFHTKLYATFSSFSCRMVNILNAASLRKK